MGAQEVTHQLGNKTHQIRLADTSPRAPNSRPVCQPCTATAPIPSVSSQLSTISSQTQRSPSSQNAIKTLTSPQLPRKMSLDSPQLAIVRPLQESDTHSLKTKWPLSCPRAWLITSSREGLSRTIVQTHLPARLTELLDIDGAAESDNEEGEALGWQAVVANHGIQHLQRHLVGWRKGSHQPCPNSCPQGGNTPDLLPTLLWSVTVAPSHCQSSLPRNHNSECLGGTSHPRHRGSFHPELTPQQRSPNHPYLQENVLRLREAKQLAWGPTVSEGAA